MDGLPQELVDHISSYLDYSDLKSTLFLSRKFQYAAEQYSEAFSDCSLTPEGNAAKFLSIYSGYRFRYLRTVSFKTSVPAIDTREDAEESCRDTAKELKAMDDVFTHQINFLFSTLGTLESRIRDAYKQGRIHLTIFTPTRDLYRGECYHRMFTSWRVHLLSPSALPSLASVRSLTFTTNPSCGYDRDGRMKSIRKLDLRVLLDIATKCHNLETLQCRIGRDEWLGGFISQAMEDSCQDWAGPRRDSRQDFCKALQTLPCLRHVQLDFLWPIDEVEDFDQRAALPNLIKPALYDTFSTSLRLLSQPLRTMSLRVCADETLFWPTDSSSKTPFWPNMESLNIMFHMSNPSGSWYFQGLPGVGSSDGYDVTNDHYPPYAPTDKDYADDSDNENSYIGESDARCKFRVDPNKEMLVPFLTAFAKAVSCMPLLKEFAVWSPLKFRHWEYLDGYENFDASTVCKVGNALQDLAWGIVYTAPGEQDFTCHPKADYSPSRRIWWKVAKWRPDSKLHSLFQKVGHEKHGSDLIESWNYFDCDEGLDSREWFTDWERKRWTVDPDS